MLKIALTNLEEGRRFVHELTDSLVYHIVTHL